MLIKSMCGELETFLQQYVHVIYIFHISSLMRIHQNLQWSPRVKLNAPRNPRLTQTGKQSLLNNVTNTIIKMCIDL